MISGAPSQKERKISKNEKKKPPPPPEKWKTGLCDCFFNCGTCCLVSFCFNTIAAQLYTRFVQKGCCLVFALLLWGLFLFETSYSSYTPNTWTLSYNARTETFTLSNDQMFLVAIMAVCSLVYTILITYLVCAARRRVRSRDAIPGNDCDDCCVSYFCTCCTQAQILTQENINAGNYVLTSTTGTNAV